MDWLRRNWPDLLIGVALVAVIAGIIATLISGGTFFPVGGGSRTAETPTQTPTQAAGPAVAGANQGGAQASQNSAAAGDPAGAADAPAAGAQAQDPSAAPAVSLADAPAGQSADPAASAGAAQSQAGGIAVLPPDGQPRASSLTTTAPAAAAPSASPQSTVTPAANVAASSLPEAPYRVSVGAYGNVDNAQRQLETFRAAGYPVFLGTQGNLTIVLVGPYDTEAEARGVALRISQSDLGVSDPTVYLLESGDQATTAQATPSASQAAAQSSAVTTPAAAPVATPAASSSSSTPTPGDRYLQVGAYGSRGSSLPQRERLEGLGFVVSERLESDLVKLLVGPFDDSGLATAQSRLQAAGIDSFPR